MSHNAGSAATRAWYGGIVSFRDEVQDNDLNLDPICRALRARILES